MAPGGHVRARGGPVRRRVRTWSVAVALVVAATTLGAPPAPADAGSPATLTKERLYALTSQRPYGTPVAIDVPGESPTGEYLTDSGVVVGSTVVDGEIRYYRWRDGHVELLPGDGPPWTELRGVNERGQVVGHRWTPEWDRVLPFVWQPDGSVVQLADTEPWLQVSGINDDGLVVGTVGDGVAVGWRDGVLTSYPSPGGGTVRLPSRDAVNARGDVVGTVTRPEDGVQRGYVWRDGVPHELPAAPDAQVVVHRVNDRGDVLAWISSSTGSGLALWLGGQRMRFVDRNDRYQLTPTDLNERGVVVGDANRPPTAGAVRSDVRGVAMPLPGLGGRGTVVRAVHDLDVAVGGAYRADDPHAQPVMWVLTAPVPLGRRLDGVEAFTGWAVDINRHGQVLGRLNFGGDDGWARVVLWDLRRG